MPNFLCTILPDIHYESDHFSMLKRRLRSKPYGWEIVCPPKSKSLNSYEMVITKKFPHANLLGYLKLIRCSRRFHHLRVEPLSPGMWNPEYRYPYDYLMSEFLAFISSHCQDLYQDFHLFTKETFFKIPSSDSEPYIELFLPSAITPKEALGIFFEKLTKPNVTHDSPVAEEIRLPQFFWNANILYTPLFGKQQIASMKIKVNSDSLTFKFRTLKKRKRFSRKEFATFILHFARWIQENFPYPDFIRIFNLYPIKNKI